METPATVYFKVTFRRTNTKDVEFTYPFSFETVLEDPVQIMMDAFNRANQYLQSANGSAFAGIVRIEADSPH